MEILIKALQLIACLSLLVVLHEAGHFMFAKFFKCRVEKFYLFFNPWFSVFKFKIGETEYGLGWIPFGGYVKIAGMVDESMDKEQMKLPPQPWEFRSKPAWQRLLIMIGGVLMNIIAAFVIYIGLSYTYGKSYIKADDVTTGYEFSQLGKEMGFKNGDKILSLDGKKYEEYSEIPMAFILNDITSAVVERNGEEVHIPIDFEYKATLLESGQPLANLRGTTKIDSVLYGSAAATAGIQQGDSVISVNGTPIQFRDQYSSIMAMNSQKQVPVTVMRDSSGVKIEKTVAMAIGTSPITGVFFSPFIGNIYKITTVDYTLLEAIPAGIHRGVTMLSDYIKQLKMIFTPDTGAYKQVGSVVAMGNFFPATWDWLRFWNITALFSVMLAVMNLLPIPALDGGHVVFLLYEVITRRKPSDKFMEVMQSVGMILLLAIMVLALGNDLFRLFK